jgi:N-acyl-D-amino-acid deacylase
MTGSTAAIFGLGAGDLRRGTLAVGAAADLVVFDPRTVADRATYENGRAFATGVDAVLIGGVPALLDGRLTGDLAGRVIRGPAR